MTLSECKCINKQIKKIKKSTVHCNSVERERKREIEHVNDMNNLGFGSLATTGFSFGFSSD